MWHIYISIAVLFSGAFCSPVKQIVEDSNCTVVIKRFGEQVTTLEVKWDSNIHLICDASCVGPGPQPGLTWFYIDKNQGKRIHIERLFQSQKFQTYPINFHRSNVLVIRHFGPNEEIDFICEGSIKRERVEAKVTLNGTDCLLKYNFRCKSDDKCIDRGYLCNQNKECPDGEDEVGCDNDMNTTTTVATTRIPETSVGTKKTSDEIDYNDMTMTVSTIMMPQTDVKTKQTSEEIVTEAPPAECTAEQYKCVNGMCLDVRFRCDGLQDCPDNDTSDENNCQIPLICPEGKKGCKDFSKCIDDSQLCNRVPDCTDGSDEKDCDLSTEPQTSMTSQQKDDDKYDVTEDKTKILMVNVGVNIDGDNGLLSTTDGFTNNTAEFTDTMPFDYDLYAK